jgi:hypothetical protein
MRSERKEESEKGKEMMSRGGQRAVIVNKKL